jgi:GDP-L-fucose synthase
LKVVILGGHGFVGKNLVKELNESDSEVYPYSRDNGLDLMDLVCTNKLLLEVQPDVIVNCAAHVGSVHYGLKHPATIFHDNMQMILNLFKSVAESCPSTVLINPISNCVYPMEAEIQVESQLWTGMPHPSALPYASTRRMIYVISKSYLEENGIISRNLIFPGVYGPGNHTDTERVHALDGIIIRMIRAHRSSADTFEIWGTGKPIREWCYIDDIVSLVIKTIEMNGELIDPVNIGQKKGYSVRELAEMTAKTLGFEGKLIFNTDYPDGAAIKVLDNKRFREYFFGHEFMCIEEGISKTVKYYQSVL